MAKPPGKARSAKGPPNRAAAAKPPVATNDPRALAVDALNAVLRQSKPLDAAFNLALRKSRLEPRDRAFLRHLLTTTLRRLGQIDDLIETCLEKPLKPRQWALQDLLRVGVCQLVFLEVPAHAAVDTIVRLAKGNDLAPFKGLVNALLRRLSREAKGLTEAQDPARLCTPDWLWLSWCETYGEDTARAIAEANLTEASLDISVKQDPEDWAKKLKAELLPTGSLRVQGKAGEVLSLPGFAEGGWWIQDAAAALPGQLFGDLTGKGVVDLCAAPGGKTVQLAAAGATVTAVDRSAPRLKLLKSNLKRLGLDATTALADVATWRPEQPAEAVLLDAPCSGTGTLRRHPDIAHGKGPEQVASLVQIQDRLLAAAAEIVAPGGLLVYVVCSLQPEEGPARIAAFLASPAGAAFERVPLDPAELAGEPGFITGEGELRTLPCHWQKLGGLDGFYAARLRRR